MHGDDISSFSGTAEPWGPAGAPGRPVTVRKETLSWSQKLMRFIASSLDPLAYLHMFRMLNYYHYTHVQPRRRIEWGAEPSVSPDACFSNPERISFGDRVRIGSRCHFWAGPSWGRIEVGDDCLFGPEVLLTAAQYRFNDGSPVTEQPMDEGSIIVGHDVWFGARAMVMPGVRIGNGAIIGAGSLVTRDVAAGSIAVGVPAQVVGERAPVYPLARPHPDTGSAD